MRLRQAKTHAPNIRADIEDRRTCRNEAAHKGNLLALRADQNGFRPTNILFHIKEEFDVLCLEYDAVLSDLDTFAIRILLDNLLHLKQRHESLARQFPIQAL